MLQRWVVFDPGGWVRRWYLWSCPAQSPSRSLSRCCLLSLASQVFHWLLLWLDASAEHALERQPHKQSECLERELRLTMVCAEILAVWDAGEAEAGRET